MKDLYCISGLGADSRVFDFLHLPGFKLNHIRWIDPLVGESIENYASRLTRQINTARPILIAVSFGGMVAIEISKLIEIDHIILISSVKKRSDIPCCYKIAGHLKLNRLVPTQLFRTVNPLTFWFFGAHSAAEKKLLKETIRKTDGKFAKWAVDKIVNWSNTSIPCNLIHIHGTSDKLLPLKTAHHKISGGEHLMIVSRGEEVSQLIGQILDSSSDERTKKMC